MTKFMKREREFEFYVGYKKNWKYPIGTEFSGKRCTVQFLCGYGN